MDACSINSFSPFYRSELTGDRYGNAVIVVITAVIGKDENGAIGQAFMQIINNFVAQVNANTGVQ